MLDRSFSLSQLRSAGHSAITTSLVGYSPGMQVYLVRGWVRVRVRVWVRVRVRVMAGVRLRVRSSGLAPLGLGPTWLGFGSTWLGLG